MARVESRPAEATHEVFNQSTPLEGYNVLAEIDRCTRRCGARGGVGRGRALEVGEIAGRADDPLGIRGEREHPNLHTHDRFGNRIDEVEFHPAWHELMRVGIGHGLHALPWREPQPGAHVA